jgi:hypothetical protein
MAEIILGKPVISGKAEGVVLSSDEPLSFWGGYDHQTGEITDRRHPLSGKNASGKILLLPFTRGSSTTTAVLLESVRAGTAPAAILTKSIDSFLALASIVADKMYRRPIPIIRLSEDGFRKLAAANRVQIDEDGRITILSQ